MTLDDLRCRCKRLECDAPLPDVDRFNKLLELEKEVGFPLTITSGVRCTFWNAHEGGKANSGHLFDGETDLACPTGIVRFQLVAAAFKLGFDRIGIGKTFIHIGQSPNLVRRVIWTYY